MQLHHTILFVTGLFINTAVASDWSGNIALESRFFKQRDGFESNNFSAAFEPDWFYQADGSRDSIAFTGFLRIDENDDERSHADIRELYWQKVQNNWELTLGVNKVFWGVTETIHLVDVINQTDSIENIDNEDRLGQLMAQFTLIQNWGTLDLFVLPGFRERTFPESDGRPQLTPLLVDNDNALYESNDEDNHIDYAVRWSHIIDIWDLGISYFTGTNREPEFVLNNNQGVPTLTPLYRQIDQIGIDLQATLAAWLLKLELIHRSDQASDFIAAALGFEYTFVGVLGSNADIGLVVEYLYDERSEQPFGNDLAVGGRFVLNDTQSSELLVAMLNDLDNQSISYFIEASRRIGSNYKLSIELRGATNVDALDPVIALERDRLLQAEFAYFF